MTKVSHTLGPWTTWPDSTLPGVIHINTDRTIAIVDPVNGRANARLIAAAPDLLSALENLLRETSGGSELCARCFAEQAAAAIAKAKGSSL